ncbi:MAG: hypothetical protein KAH32_06375, partial [Chlamydiia bacterium]|nr:hypothetical protein [Chlamydiia bacterium]
NFSYGNNAEEWIPAYNDQEMFAAEANKRRHMQGGVPITVADVEKYYGGDYSGGRFDAGKGMDDYMNTLNHNDYKNDYIKTMRNLVKTNKFRGDEDDTYYTNTALGLRYDADNRMSSFTKTGYGQDGRSRQRITPESAVMYLKNEARYNNAKKAFMLSPNFDENARGYVFPTDSNYTKQ